MLCVKPTCVTKDVTVYAESASTAAESHGTQQSPRWPTPRRLKPTTAFMEHVLHRTKTTVINYGTQQIISYFYLTDNTVSCITS